MFTCSVCINEFEGHFNKRYCVACYDLKFGKFCEVCNSFFVDRKHPDKKRCSFNCGVKNHKTYIDTTCTYCNAKIERWQVERNENYFCTSVCALEHYRENSESRKGIYICQWCNKEFEEYIYRTPTFCSRSCSSKYSATLPRQKPPKTKKICLICESEFFVYPSRSFKKYCKNCDGRKYENAYDRLNGKDSHLYKGGIEEEFGNNWVIQRKKALKRDGYTCQMCGYIKGQNTMKIAVHHIIARREFLKISIEHLEKEGNKLSNLITLCASCHGKVEFGNTDCPHPIT